MCVPALVATALAIACPSSTPFEPRLACGEIPPTLGDTPPKGPPWRLTYREARRHALRTGTPVFVYFTKTY